MGINAVHLTAALIAAGLIGTAAASVVVEVQQPAPLARIALTGYVCMYDSGNLFQNWQSEVDLQAGQWGCSLVCRCAFARESDYLYAQRYQTFPVEVVGFWVQRGYEKLLVVETIRAVSP